MLDYAIAAGQIVNLRTTSLMAFEIDAFPVVGETCQQWLDEWLEQSLGRMTPPPTAAGGRGNRPGRGLDTAMATAIEEGIRRGIGKKLSPDKQQQTGQSGTRKSVSGRRGNYDAQFLVALRGFVGSQKMADIPRM